MNTKIRKIAKDAGLYVEFDGNLYPKALGAEEAELAYEKFAKTIIKECESIVNDYGMFLRFDGLAQKINKHFGGE